MAEAKVQNSKSIVKEQGYDETPYTSYPFDYNQPERLNAVATLFGIDAPALETARVLEIGGADGANLLRFATNFPKSKCVGVDLSEVQINIGKERVKKLGLKNYELKHMSITDLEDNAGTFDYIICHGVFSWVPEEVREGILAKCKKHLSKNGVAFISYNTLPGWNMVNTIRELMVYHSSNFTDLNDKVAQARLALQFIVDTLKDNTDPYSNFMRKMANELQSKENHYIRHEYLADENTAFYFRDFATQAQKHGLSYVGDTEVYRMFIGNLPQKTAEKLSQINDIIQTEQYLDFIRNSQFRCTLLCHDNVSINRNITSETLNNFYYSGIFRPERELDEKEVYSATPLKLGTNGAEQFSITANSSELKAIFSVLTANHTNPLKPAEIVNLAVKSFPKLDKTKVGQSLELILAKLIFSNYLKFYTYKPMSLSEISDKPKLSLYNTMRYKDPMAERTMWLINESNQMIGLEDHLRFIVPLFDGKNTIPEIGEKIVGLIKEGKLIARRDEKDLTEEEEIREVAGQFTQYALEIFKNNSLLVG